MQDLYIEAAKDTPKIRFVAEKGELYIEGQSYPESASEFYNPIIELIEQYGENKKANITVNFKFTYFNTSSSKAILDILDILEIYHEQGKNPKVNWFYEKDDEDIKESGEEFAEDIKYSFNILED
jgi:hypothetical protein